ncbi:MAG: prephenate dehydratase [Planctomycetaceae bacterium]
MNPPDLTPELESLDRQLLELLIQRCELVRRSDSSNLPLADSPALASLPPTVDRAAAAQWLRHASSIALIDAHRQRVAYLGPEYSYSHLAAIKVFGAAHPMAALASISAVFDAILRGDALLGVVPIENSTDGRVVDTLGMFVRVSVKVCGEVLLPIHHNLLSRSPRESITEVYSKPQALSQCRGWLASHMPKARLIEISSTAAAAELAATKPGAAAVASLEAGCQYGLDVIDASIEDNPNNVTRFAILGRHSSPPTGNDKTAILFQVAHRPGALADAMMIFKQAGLNLTWIESFPVPGTTAEYLFFIETVGHETDAKVAAALEQLRAITIRLDVMGSYPKAAAIS